MSLRNGVVICLALLFLIYSTVACEKEGTAEKAGKEAVRALASAKKKINEATK